MLNTVRAAATALPAAIFDRRRMLLGLAAASTAAASPAAVAASKPAPVEAAALLDLGAKTAFALANYRNARAEREAIVAAWAPKWPEPAACILNRSDASKPVVNLEGDSDGRRVWSREWLVENIAYFEAGPDFRKNAKPERIARTKAAWAKFKAEREGYLASLDAYNAQCAMLVNASGIRPAQAAEVAARNALQSHVREVMALEPVTMAGVLIQAEALEALASIPQLHRVTWAGNSVRFHEGYGERIAASILRIAGNA